MSDNPRYGTAPVFALPDASVIALRGRDALAFAQAQFMNDVAGLADGDWQWNGWLDPKGRVQALFALLRLDAFSVKKGCYPGQEIVARTHFLGRAKRGLARIRAAGAQPGDPLLGPDDREAGTVIASVGADALAVLPLDAADVTYRLRDRDVERLAFADGLSR
jgi:folate-binding protein YgfZ